MLKRWKNFLQQFDNDNVQIILGVGSCGTFAGTILGAKIFIPNARVIGISVSRTVDAIKKRTKELIKESSDLINYKIMLMIVLSNAMMITTANME